MTAHRSITPLHGFWLLAAVVTCLATPARAEERPLWELGLGLAALQLPHYRGSDQHHDLVLPVPYAIYRGKIFRATREGARAVLLDSERVDVDLSLAASPPVRSKDNVARAGMPDLAPTLEFGPNVNLLIGRGQGWKLDLRLPVRGVVQLNSRLKDAGYTISPVLNADLRWEGWNLGAQAGPLWGSRRYHATTYDVSPLFATSTRPAYAASAGRGGWHWTTAATRRFGNLWLGGYVNGDRLGGAVFENSPLVRKTNTLSFGVAVAWVFAVSDERVTSED